MKSLEIVDERIEQVGKRGKVHLFSFETTIDEKDLQQIKQDLEVLEIIKNKRVTLNHIYWSKNYEEYLSYLTVWEKVRPENYLTKEEFNKLKQWLEVN